MANNFQITISAIDKTTEVVRKINQQVDRMMVPFDRVAKSANSLGNEVGTNRLIKGLTGVARGAEAAGEKIRSIIAPLTAIIGIGSIAGITALAAGLGRTQLALRNQAVSIGMSTQELQVWQGAAKLASLSAEDMNGALANVGEKLDNAFRTPETVRDMNAIGLEMHRLKNGSIDTGRAILDIASAMERQGNVETKKRIAEAFGVSSIFPLLVQGRAAVQKFFSDSSRITKPFSDQEIARAAAYQQQVLALERTFETLKNSLGLAVLPAFERVTGAVGRLVEKYGDMVASKVAEYGEQIANWIDKTDWSRVVKDVGELVDSLGGVKTIAIALAAVTLAGPMAALASMAVSAAKISALLLPVLANPLVVGVASAIFSSDLNKGEEAELAKRRGSLPGPSFSMGSPLTSNAAIDQRKVYLIGKMREDGYSDAQIAGTIGSLMQESNLDPTAVNSSSGAAGISQWLGPRKQEFERQYGKRVQDSSFEEQVNYMLWELRNTEKRSGGLLRRADTAEKAAQIHAWEYERPGVAEANIERRQANAAAVLAAMGGVGRSAPAASPGVSGSASSVASNAGVAAVGGPAQASMVVEFKGAPKGTAVSVSSAGMAVSVKGDEIVRSQL
ncbi:phage tail tip lysozyme [Herbaspirillum huttiense F1]|uniref:phage tail tip lysozyme n=1 Tax=Herbaspirillum huttiense TaxID=863372 RepID=UPI0028850BC0|nr:phage tail tip lysozyme [Herbaspirillum huttiense]MDT0355696.1 phage tail tip lysozyme [Herbaspirillum huttiense F1]